jgi:hypothetical protein
LDRRSGTGRGKELRKEGGGRNNWGTYKDDEKVYDQEAPAKEDDKPAVEGERVVKEKAASPPPTRTLEDYYKERGAELKIHATEAKVVVPRTINQDELKKDKLEVMKTKEDLKKLDVKKSAVLKSKDMYNL